MVGQSLLHYRIEERSGAGGMGEVYRANDTKLGREVAIKVLPAAMLADPAARARLIREAQTASALNHPHICTIYEVGEAGGQTYIAMELVEGRPLGSLIPADGLPTETLLRYAAQIADALAHAHDRGILHRDLKSSNIVITPEGRAKVLDFGLARRQQEELISEATRSLSPLTGAGTIAGTLHYLAPEVLRGEPADAPSDIWALGVVLYEMAAGALPFQGRTGFEVSSHILRESPAPLAPRVPAGLRAIIQRCLAKEPGQRYQRASEVRAALEAIGSDTAGVPLLPARPPAWRWLRAVKQALASSARQRRDFTPKEMLPIVIVGAVMIVAIALGTTALRLWFKSSKSAGESAPSAPFAIPEPSGPRLSTGAKPSTKPEANEYFEKAMLFMGWGQYDLRKARQMLERALELDPQFAAARAEYGFTHLLMIDSGYSNDTSWLYKAEEELRRALEEDPHSAQAHSALAAVYLHLGRKELVPGEVQKALKADPDHLRAQIWLLGYHQLNGDYAAGLAVAKQLMERNPVFWPARMKFGDMLGQQGDTAGAIRAQEKVLEQDVQNIYAISYLARTYMDIRELRKARLTLERGRPTDRQNYRTRSIWARLYALEGKRKEALTEMDDELLKHAGASVWATVEAAEFYAVLGEKDKALDWLDRAVRNRDERDQWFRRDPLLANIREHPRFKQILDSIAYRRQQRAASALPR